MSGEVAYVSSLLAELGITDEMIAARGFTLHLQPSLPELVVQDIDIEGKPFVLTAPAARAWSALVNAAQKDGISILPFSGFRSYLYQRGLIRRHLNNGRSLQDILTQLAPPGYSEHHTGRAVDLTAPGIAPLAPDLELTPTFSWLQTHAAAFGFSLSYPRNNPRGFIYEPWHWCFHQ